VLGNSFRRLGCWAIFAAGWALILAMPFRVSAETNTVAVVFPPWMNPHQQITALVSADLLPLERRGPLTLVGTSIESVDLAALRRTGAWLVIDETSLALCSTTAITTASGTQIASNS